jgi:N-acetylmuramoyl-L-alanine amidase
LNNEPKRPVGPVWTVGVNIDTIDTAVAPPAIEWTNRERDLPTDDRGFAIMLWLLRVRRLLIAATLACAAAPAARAEPRSADACGRGTFRAIIDVGHTEQAPGARSARGVPEFAFNLNLAKHIEQQLLAAGFRRSVLLITEGPARKGLVERVKRANVLGADLFLSIHHDSVPEKFKEKWEFEGEQRSFSDRFSGHSIFISQDSRDRDGSLLFASLLGSQLRKRGLQYTSHYTDRIMGNRQRLLVDVLAGVYRYDQLIVLRNTGMPAVLLEAGSIINREEELRMGSVEHQTLVSAAVVDAVQSFCTARRLRSPTNVAGRTGGISGQAKAPAAVAPVRPINQR